MAHVAGRWRGEVKSFEEHLADVLGLGALLDAQAVPLASGLGRTLAAPVRSPIELPPFANSAMDGFAVRAADTVGATQAAPVALPVEGRIHAGDVAQVRLAARTAMRIMTGAPLPLGADAVVPQESTRFHGDRVEILDEVAQGRHVRQAGEDVRVGDEVMAPGVRMAARHLAAIAATGAASVLVRRRPLVRVIVTGNELVAPGLELPFGSVFDSNGTYLEAALTGYGADVERVGVVGDSPAAVITAMGGSRCDLIVTTGGASVGDADPVKEALNGRGVVFESVAMQPGKPQGWGRYEGVPVVCLPGNPVAVAVCVEVLVAPLIRRMLGIDEPRWRRREAGASWSTPPGRAQFIPVVAVDGRVVPAHDAGSGSHLIGRLARARSLARVEAGVAGVERGDTVLVRRFGA